MNPKYVLLVFPEIALSRRMRKSEYLRMVHPAALGEQLGSTASLCAALCRSFHAHIKCQDVRHMHHVLQSFPDSGDRETGGKVVRPLRRWLGMPDI
jgi:hypothetical protein